MGHVGDALRKHDAEGGEPDGKRRKSPAPAVPAVGKAVAAELASTPVRAEPIAAADRPSGNHIASDAFEGVLVAHHDRGSPITEQYRVIRTNLLAKFPKRRFCTLVTSAQANEGKTVTCLNLGLTLAELQEGRTLLVDCDLRKGSMASFLGVNRGRGVADILRGEAKLDDVICTTDHPGLDILTSGVVAAPDVGTLLGRPEVEELFTRLRQQYDFVLIDTPPVNEISDAGILGRYIHGALLIVGMFKTRRESVRKAIRMLHAVNIDILGMVLTKQKHVIPKYVYRYIS